MQYIKIRILSNGAEISIKIRFLLIEVGRLFDVWNWKFQKRFLRSGDSSVNSRAENWFQQIHKEYKYKPERISTVAIKISAARPVSGSLLHKDITWKTQPTYSKSHHDFWKIQNQDGQLLLKCRWYTSQQTSRKLRCPSMNQITKDISPRGEICQFQVLRASILYAKAAYAAKYLTLLTSIIDFQTLNLIFCT